MPLVPDGGTAPDLLTHPTHIYRNDIILFQPLAEEKESSLERYLASGGLELLKPGHSTSQSSLAR